MLQAEMRAALAEAAAGRSFSAPNPSVGCLVVDALGRVLGQGHTQPPGGPHAEIMALRDAHARGNPVAGATAYVTLEPCSHHGRTGPCCDALIAAGIGKVVASLEDPNPLVAGRGFARLRTAGIDVEIGAGAAESRELNLGFFSRMVRKEPWVRMKVAASLDGSTALANGTSQWITSQEARADGHAWRGRAGALLTGIGTVLQDNPQLTVRHAPSVRQPDIAVVDSRLQTPVDARVFVPGRRVLIYAAVQDDAAKAALEAAGATVVTLRGPHGKVDLKAMLHDLAEREVNDLHVEAGFKLNGSLVREGLVDEFLIYLAPILLGQGGHGIAALGPLETLAEGTALEFIAADRIGPDLRLRARIPGRDRF